MSVKQSAEEVVQATLATDAAFAAMQAEAAAVTGTGDAPPAPAS